MAYATRLTWIELKRQIIFARNYLFQEVSGLVVFYIFFVGLIWSWQGSTLNYASSNHLFLGYLLWTYAVAAVSLLAFDISEEAQSGTLEQIAIVPRYLRPWLFRCFANFVLQTGRATILYFLIITTTNTRPLTLTVLQACVAGLTIIGLYGIGLAVGAVTLVCKKTTHLVNIIHFFLFFFTGIAIPIDSLPAGLYTFAQVIPLTHGMRLFRQLDLVGSINPATGQFLLLLTITTILWITLGVTALLLAYRYARVNGIFNRF